MKCFENSFETRKGCLSCSIRVGNHFCWKIFWKNRIFFLWKMSHSAENPRSLLCTQKRLEPILKILYFLSLKRCDCFFFNPVEVAIKVPKTRQNAWIRTEVIQILFLLIFATQNYMLVLSVELLKLNSNNSEGCLIGLLTSSFKLPSCTSSLLFLKPLLPTKRKFLFFGLFD